VRLVPVRRSLAVLFATAVLFLLGGTAIGYYVVPDSKGRSAQCIVLANDLEGLTYNGGTRSSTASKIVEMYNDHCR